ncbi:MAG: hypothetical protein ACO1RT_09670 [Planctomycetaceae bacterium]
MMSGFFGAGAWLGVSVVCLALVAASPACGRDAGEFEGAVWTIELTPKRVRDGQKLRATYRISNHVLFQKVRPTHTEYTKEVGKNHPNGNRTRTHFRELAVFNKSRERTMTSGWATLQLDSRGEWSGQFIDSGGKHWDCRVRRVQE